MNKQTKRMLAKERSFVGKLTNAQIEKILLKCGYVLNKILYDDYGETLPAIERGYDSEKDEYSIFIRCKKINPVADKVAHALKSATKINLSNYNLTDSIVMLKDFEFIELTVLSDNISNNQEIYARHMYNLFGEYYRKEYNKNIRKNVKQKEKEN